MIITNSKKSIFTYCGETFYNNGNHNCKKGGNNESNA